MGGCRNQRFDYIFISSTLSDAIQCNPRFRMPAVESQRIYDQPEDQRKRAVSSVNRKLLFVTLGRLPWRRALDPSDDDKESEKYTRYYTGS